MVTLEFLKDVYKRQVNYMEIGVIGLGKMGYGLACNLKDNGYKVYGYDINNFEVAKAADYGIGAYSELSEFLKSFENKKIIFLMTPSGVIVDETIEKILPELNRGDIIIDAGNSNFNDSIRRYKSLKEKGIDFLDCGTSGGPRGARHGACTMIAVSYTHLDRFSLFYDSRNMLFSKRCFRVIERQT